MQEYNNLDKRIIKIFEQAQNSINDAFFEALNQKDFKKAQFLLSKIKIISEELKNKYTVYAYIRAYMEYYRGYSYAGSVAGQKQEYEKLDEISKLAEAQMLKEIEKIGLILGPVHVQAIKTLLDTTYGAVFSSIDGVNRTILFTMSKISGNEIRQRLAVGESVGDSISRQTNSILKLFREKGVGFFKDKSGRIWNARTYAENIVRTETARAYNQATVNRGLELGYTRFKVVELSDCCSICQPHNGKVYDFKSKESIELPPYHNNCRGTVEIEQG